MRHGHIYLGTIARKSGAKLYVIIPALGNADDQFGPMNAITAPTDNPYEKGDKVVVGQYGVVYEDLIVLGKVDAG